MFKYLEMLLHTYKLNGGNLNGHFMKILNYYETINFKVLLDIILLHSKKYFKYSKMNQNIYKYSKISQSIVVGWNRFVPICVMIDTNSNISRSIADRL